MRMENLTPEQALMTLPQQQWDSVPTPSGPSAVEALEQGKLVFLPDLRFPLLAGEIALLDPALVDIKRKNISYWPETGKLSGVAIAAQQPQVETLLSRYYQASLQLVAALLPQYQQALHSPVNTLRLHPVAAWRETSSWRKDDSRLHVDAFPSRPNYGERILRIFTNINPAGELRGASANPSLNWRNALCLA